MESGIGGPGEDEESDRNKPAGKHHRDQTSLSRGLSIILLVQ